MSAQNQPRFALATPTLEFNSKDLRKLLYSAKSYQELAPAKKYLISYFARGDEGVYRWRPRKQSFKWYTKKNACDSFIQSDLVEFKNDKGEVISRFDIRTWFFRETPFFSLEVNPLQPKIYREVDGGYYINLFLGFLHSNPPPFHDFSQEIRDKVKLILNHMKEVLCSSDEKQAYYMKNLSMRIAIGQKMQKSLFLYSGQGTGKTMLTVFLRKMVLGLKITHKTANERIITGQFNKELEGKCLLVLEEMSNSKSTDWITFANRLKDFIDSDMLTIEEKHKTSYEVANITNLIISSNNSKTIRLDRDDRRYFIPDVSDKYVKNGTGMDHYYAPLDKAMKDPEVGKAFYSYALEYVKLNPDFDERKVPMTKTKLMMINRDNNAVHEFIKEKYVCKNQGLEESSSSLYSDFKEWYEACFGPTKKPSNIQEFTCSLASLELKAKQKRIGDRKAGKRVQWYSSSYNDLYTVFMNKNMIDEAENIEEPEGYQHEEKMYIHPTENLPKEPELLAESMPENSPPSQLAEPEIIPDAPKEAPKKKTPPPLPPKSEGIKARVKLLKSESSKTEPELDPASIPLPESPKMEAVVAEPIPAITLEPEPYGIPGPSNTSKPAVIPKIDPEAGELLYNPWLKNSKEDMINELYTSAEKYWIKLEIGNPEDFDWCLLIEEIKDREVNNCLKSPSNKWEALIDIFVERLRRWIVYNKKLERSISNEEIVDFLEKYQRNSKVNPPSCETVKVIETIPHYIQTMEKECMGEDYSDDDDNELDGLWG